MNSARFRFDGLAELLTGLRQLPGALSERAGSIVAAQAQAAAADIAAQYPIGPGDGDGYEGGNLRKGIRVGVKHAGQYGHTWQVRSTARHAWMFESGTQSRVTRLGYERGSMPGANIFVPTMQKYRRAMYDELRDVMREAGLDVRG